jgi:hypothetical protein
LVLRSAHHRPTYPAAISGDAYLFMHMSKLPPDALAMLVKKSANYALVTHHGSWFGEYLDESFVHDFLVTRGRKKHFAITTTMEKFIRQGATQDKKYDKPPSPDELAATLRKLTVWDSGLSPFLVPTPRDVQAQACTDHDGRFHKRPETPHPVACI